MPIDTREELINALHEASEIEHGLLVQYLYAIFTMKRRIADGLTPRQQMMSRSWQSSMLTVAREEMAHLGIVSNLLAAIGAAPKFSRPNMPQKTGYYPFPFDLQPLGDTALHRFLTFELPRGMPPPPPPGEDPRGAVAAAAKAFPAPDPIEFLFVGELYAKIADGIKAVPESRLFIGPQAAQMDWPGIGVTSITGTKQALDAIKIIIEQGEGTPADVENSHYDRFRDIRLAHFDGGRFSAALNVPVNPATREFRDAEGAVTMIRNPDSLLAAETFNAVYGTMLLLLSHVFSMAPVSAAAQSQRAALQDAAGQLMSTAVRPLGEMVAEMPLGDPADPSRAGPPFEIYGDVSASPYPEARWSILFERFDAVAAACATLGEIKPRAALAGETLGFLRRNLEQAKKDNP